MIIKFSKRKILIIHALVSIFIYCVFIYKQNELINDQTPEIRYKTLQTASIEKNFQPEILFTGQQNSNYVTVVCAYFTFNKSKHGEKKYKQWLDNFLKSVSAPMVIYTDNLNKEFIFKFREKLNLTTKIIVYNNIWQIMHELEMKRGQKYINNYLNVQNNLDPEKSIHSPELYAIWNLKPYMVNKAAHENQFKSEFFIYTDAGSFRQRSFVNWPKEEYVKNVHKQVNNRLVLGLVDNIKYHTNPLNDLIEGTFFAGSIISLSTFETNFYEIHDERLYKGLFIGKDQTITNILGFEKHPNTITFLYSYKFSNFCSCSGDNWILYSILNYFRCTNNKWFFFIHYFYSEINCSVSRDSMIINDFTNHKLI